MVTPARWKSRNPGFEMDRSNVPPGASTRLKVPEAPVVSVSSTSPFRMNLMSAPSTPCPFWELTTCPLTWFGPRTSTLSVVAPEMVNEFEYGV